MEIQSELSAEKAKRQEVETKIEELKVKLEEKQCDFNEAPKSEHNRAQAQVEIEYLKAETAAQDKKLSDYIVESFVRINGLENKLEEVINFVNVNVSNASKNSKAPRKSTTAGHQNPKFKDFT